MTKKEKEKLEAELDELKEFMAQVEHFNNRLKDMGFVKRFQDTQFLNFETYLGRETYANDLLGFNFIIMRHPSKPLLRRVLYNGSWITVKNNFNQSYDAFIKMLWDDVEPRAYKKAQELQDSILKMLKEF